MRADSSRKTSWRGLVGPVGSSAIKPSHSCSAQVAVWGSHQVRIEVRTGQSGDGPRCLILTVSWVGTYLLPLSLSGKSSKKLHFFAHTHNLNHPGTNTPVHLGSFKSLALFLCYYTLKIER